MPHNVRLMEVSTVKPIQALNLIEKKEEREAKIASTRFEWAEEHEADDILAELLDSKEFQDRLREFLTDWASAKGDFEYFIQSCILNYRERNGGGVE